MPTYQSFFGAKKMVGAIIQYWKSILEQNSIVITEKDQHVCE